MYTIKQTTGAYIRETMRSADSAEEAAEKLMAIAHYTDIGETVTVQDDGDIVLTDETGRVVAFAREAS